MCLRTRRENNFKSPAGRRAGFSLVELLVVIGVIALLIGILLPTLEAAKAESRRVACLSNLRQIGIAAMAYSQQNRNHTVPGYADMAISNPSARSDAENYATVIINERLISAPLLNALSDPVSGEGSVFRCTSGTEEFMFNQFSDANGTAPAPINRLDSLNARPLRTRSKGTGIVVDTWYGINASINDFSKKTPVTRYDDSSKNQIPKMNQIRDTTRMVFLFDGVFANLYFNANRLGARHGNVKAKLTNILFFDGHADTFATAGLPGGMGPIAIGTDLFSPAALQASGNPGGLLWRLDQLN